MTRWRTAATMLVVAALTALSAGSAAARETAGTAGAPTKITVAYANAAANFTPLFVGIGEGFFAQNGLDVTPFLASGGRGNAILQSGDAQINLDSGEPNITAIARGGDFVMLGATANRFGFKLVARKPIARVQDLRGKKLALSSPTAAVGTAGEALLKQFNLLGQVEIVYIPSITARLAALENGSVDAIILSPPVGDIMKSGRYNDVYDLRSLRFVLVGIWARRDWAERNQETVRAFLRGLTQAMTWMVNPKNEAKAKQYLSQVTGFKDAPLLDEAYKYEISRYQYEPNIDRRALENSIAVVERTVGRDIDANSFLSLGALQRVLTYQLKGTFARGKGTFSGTINPQGQLAYRLSLRGLSGPATSAHVHIGEPGKIGPARVRLCAPCRPNQSGTVKAYSAVATAIKLGNAYVSVKTKKAPKGETRAQIAAELGR